MNRLTLLPFILVGLMIAVYVAPGFVFSIFLSTFLVVFGVRWFLRAAGRPGRRGVWR
ncbi:hypothetical protein ACFXPS_05615 [Nocardia sp. NPDC059091]|uniref:hypothetical protein n=1 Tax=unclassified Nocardia TaxID=2637762 RepID=UPI0036811C3B